ncbi:MAG: hypothetical protein WBD71_14855, partial [Xanthobacteraceae bacterium]
MNFRLPPFGGRVVPHPKRLFALAILTVPLGLLSGCGNGVLTPRGPIGSANAIILLDAVGIMSAIVVPTIIAVLAFAWWFRA